MSVLAKPLMLLPFPMTIIYGIARILPHRYIFTLLCLLEMTNATTLGHLFIYRYTVVKNYSKYPWHVFLMFFIMHLASSQFVFFVAVAYDGKIDEIYKVRM